MTALVLQVVRESQVNRREVRAAARVIRSEVVRNISTVQAVLVFALVSPMNEVRIRTTRLDARIDQLAIDIPRDELGLLLSFLQMSEQASSVIESAKARPDHVADPRALDWLANTWMPAADFCQVLLDLRGMRAWDILLMPRGWWTFRQRRAEIILSGGFATPQLDEFLKKTASKTQPGPKG